MKNFYLLGAIVGLVVPLYFGWDWFSKEGLEHGFNVFIAI